MATNMLQCELARVTSLYFEGLDTPISLGLHLRMKYGEWEQVLAVKLDPRTYLDQASIPRRFRFPSTSYAADAAAVGFLKKYPKLPVKVDRKAAALEKWWQGEKDCFRTNERLTRYLPEFASSADRDPLICRLIEQIRKVILGWLGSKPDDLAIGKFGPGATFSDKADEATIPHKMSSQPVMTHGAIWFLPQWLGTQWGSSALQHHGKLEYVRGNRFTTAPKTALTDRAIACEPSINLFYQLALGRQLKSRLRKRGCWDMTRAQELHRLVAESSSVSREFATLDLSNASDTLSYNLVRLLLPPHWFDQLDGLRSPFTRMKIGGQQRWVKLEKFSSMGNGFTFELETIIFAAISVVVTRESGGQGWLGRDTFVFGDDIIVKNEIARPLKLVLEFLGFKLNVEKSFFGDEPFRESCGGDFFAGKPVRPYSLKRELNGPQDYIVLANGISAQSERLTRAGVSLPLRSWFAVLDCLPSRVRQCRGPKALGDIVIHDEQDRWTGRWRGSIRYLKSLRPHRKVVIPYEVFEDDVILACATYGTGNSNIGGVIPRDGILSYKVGWVPYS